MATRTRMRKDRPKSFANFSELGYSGLPIFAGQVRDEYLRELKGKNGIKVYREMKDNDPIVGAILFAVNMLMRQADWQVKGHPDDPDKTKQEDIEFVQSCLGDMSETWPDVISEALTMMPFGWSWLETVYKKRQGRSRNSSSSRFTDGKIGWAKMPLRSQESFKEWIFDGPEATMPIIKSLLFRTEHNKNNPEGRSVLRNIYRPWFFGKRIEEIEGIGIERDLAGLPVLTPPEGEDIWNRDDPVAQATRAEAEIIVKSIRRDEQEGVVKPFGWELELLSTGGRRAFDTNAIMERYNNSKAMTLLADFIMLGHNNRYGSFALSSSKTTLFASAVGGWMRSVAAVFNRYAIPRLLELNGMDSEYPPTLDPGDIELPDLAELGTYVANLTRAGFKMFPNIPIEQKLLQNAGLPIEGVELGREPITPGFDAEGNPLPDPNKAPADGDEEDEDKPKGKEGVPNGSNATGKRPGATNRPNSGGGKAGTPSPKKPAR
jgi:hypothetical protein